MRFVRALAVATALSSTAALAACSGGTTVDGRAETPLQVALGEITATASTRGSVLFSRQDATYEADGGKVAGRYMRALGLGAGALGPLAAAAKPALGFDLDTIDTAVQAGSALHAGTLLTGVPTAAGIGARLVALGAQRTGDLYRLAPDDTIAQDPALRQALPGLFGFNVVTIEGSSLRFSSAAPNIDLFTGSGRVLGDDPSFRAAAACLGDPLGAELTDHPPVPAQITVPPPVARVRVVGVGMDRASADGPTETMCVVGSSASNAEAIRALVRRAMSTGTSRVAGRPWSQVLPGARVARSGVTVELTARSADGPGLLLAAIAEGDLPGVSGGY